MIFLKISWLVPRNLLIVLILLWRKLITPLYGNVCRYYPSCSTYGLVAAQRFGVVRGSFMTIWRIVRCNPWSSGGVDDVPQGPNWICVSRLGFVGPALTRRGG